MAISAEKIESNYKTHLNIINRFLSEERKVKVLAMLEDLGIENYITSPASGKDWFHNAFPGGYLDHVNRVVQYALKQSDLYSEMKGVIDFTEEELVFSALFHDLGKIGDVEKPNYLPQTSEWRKTNLGELFTSNPALQFMLIQDRSLYLLQKYGIPITEKEYLAIKLHDGLFEDTNKPYYISFSKDAGLKTNLPYILHVADLLACKIETSKNL